MLIPLKVVQFNVILRIGGKTLNRVVDPSIKDKSVQLFATDHGVVVDYAGIGEALVPYVNVQQAEAADGYSFIEGAPRRAPEAKPTPPPPVVETPAAAEEPPSSESSGIFKRKPGRPRKGF